MGTGRGPIGVLGFHRAAPGPLLTPDERRLLDAEPQEVRLSAKAWAILEQLAIYAGKVVTHGQLLRQVWGRDGETEQRYLRVYMRQLRQKLEPDPNRPQLLVTEPAVGYRLLPSEPEMPGGQAGEP
jgi:two-component system KDP operon response regulator KdpE